LKLRAAHGVAQRWRHAPALLLTQSPPLMPRVNGEWLGRVVCFGVICQLWLRTQSKGDPECTGDPARQCIVSNLIKGVKQITPAFTQ
jgi:hypothetical protein